MAGDHASPLLAMVALNAPVLPEAERIFPTLRQRYPAAPPPEEVNREGDILSFQWGDEMGFLSLIPAPIPWSELEGPCATAWWWPGARDAMQAHNSHIMVILMQGQGDPLTRHVLLTHLTAAVAAAADTAGVYWGSGTLVHEPQMFCEQAAGLTPGHLAPELWIDMRVEPASKGSYRFFTTGMEAFGRLEVEIDSTRCRPEEILDFTYGVIGYLLGGAEVKPGETIGRSATEKVRVRHAKSMWDRGQVMKLDLP